MYIEEHGGRCCGVRHIYGFDHSTEYEFERLVRQVENMDNVGTDHAFRMIEVILSDRQADKFPWLERKGFRLVSRFENANSGRFCNVFHYHPHFLALDNGAARQWNGARHSTGGNATPAPAPVDERIGQRVTYNFGGNESVPRGTAGTIIERVRENYRVRWDNGFTTGINGGHAAHLLIPLTNEVPAVRDVLTRYQNVFADGRQGGEYPNIEAARAAAPRCRRIDRIVYRSDGTIQRAQDVNN